MPTNTSEYHSAYYLRNQNAIKARDRARYHKKKAGINARRRLEYQDPKSTLRRYIEKSKNKVKIAALKRLYSLTESRYIEMLKSQGNACAACGESFSETHAMLPRVDHDHSCCPVGKSCGKCVRG